MPNWAYTDYVIEGKKETLEKIHEAILTHEVQNNSSEDWEGNILIALGIEEETVQKHSTRGFIEKETLLYKDNVLRFSASEAWQETDFGMLLEKKFPEIKVYWSCEEGDLDWFRTNDDEGKYFPQEYYADICFNGEYYSEYFNNEEDLNAYLKDITKGTVHNLKEVRQFNESCTEDDFISIHEFKIVK